MNRYFNWGSNPLRFVSRDSARAEDVNAAFDQLSASMDTLDDDIDRSLKMPPGSPSQQILLTAMQRAGLTLGFDDLGNLTAFPGGGRARGDWAPGVAYVVGDTFREASTGNLYTVAISHTSTLLSADALVGRVRLTIDVYAVEQARASAQASAASAASFRSQASTSASNAATSASQASTSAASASNSAAAAASSAASISGGPVASVNGQTGVVSIPIQTSQIDATNGRLLRVGAFGLGATYSYGAADLNTLTTSGFYRFDVAPNSPPNANYSPLMVVRSADTISQSVTAYDSANTSIRGAYGLGTAPVWTPWRRLSMHNELANLVTGNEVDLALGDSFTVLVNRPVSITISNAQAGHSFVLEVLQQSGSLSIPGALWPGGSAPTFTANKRHLIFFQRSSMDSSKWFCSAITDYPL